MFFKPRVLFSKDGSELDKLSYSSTPVPDMVRITRLCKTGDFLDNVEEVESLNLVSISTWLYGREVDLRRAADWDGSSSWA